MIEFKNVYVSSFSAVSGPIEKNGPLFKYFDKTYDDFYIGEKSWDKAESKLMKDAIDICLRKKHIDRNNIDVFVSGDLLNQIISSTYNAINLDSHYIGIYAACATSVLGIIISSVLVDNYFKNALTCTSSHNLSSEKQFRYPIEYGIPRKQYSTFTSTGGASMLLSKEKSDIKVKRAYIGKALNSHLKDPNNAGCIMAKACADTLYNYLTLSNTSVDDYDLILSGDLGKIGKEVLKDYMKEKYDIKLKNYNDAGVMLYDLKKQKVFSGGSGPACLPLVTYSYILKKKKYKKILLLATGALYSKSMVDRKEEIPVICHLVNLEVL